MNVLRVCRAPGTRRPLRGVELFERVYVGIASQTSGAPIVDGSRTTNVTYDLDTGATVSERDFHGVVIKLRSERGMGLFVGTRAGLLWWNRLLLRRLPRRLTRARP